MGDEKLGFFCYITVMQLYDDGWEIESERLSTEQRPSRGGGKKKRSKTSDTPAFSGSISAENGEKRRMREFRQEIRSFLPPKFFKKKFEHLYLKDYKKWVLASLQSGSALINEKDIDFDAKRASGHGGQKVNKTSSVPIYTHLPTGRAVESSVTPRQGQNRVYAMEGLVDDLNEHIENWINLAELNSIDLQIGVKDPDRVEKISKIDEFITKTLEIIRAERKK